MHNTQIEAIGNNTGSFSVSGLYPCASFKSLNPKSESAPRAELSKRRYSMQSSKSVFIAHAVIILLLIATGSSWGLSKSEIRQLQTEAREMNKTLPTMMSSEMQLTRVELRGDSELVYVCKSTIYSANQINPKQLENNLKPAAVNGICTTPGTLNLVKKGITFTYVYYDKANKYLSEYSITAKDCGF